jgi:anthranilate phosphoribosyltransferase
MGTFRQRIELAARPEGPFETVDALVDTGATYSSLPAPLLQRLGVQPIDTETFVLADGRSMEQPIGEATARLDGRVRTTVVIFAEEGSTPLLGAMTLEAFSLAADARNKRLVRVPGYLTVAAQPMIRDAIAKLVERCDLTEGEAAACMQEIMADEATPAQIAAFAVALRMKGETVDEIAGMAGTMREHSLHVPIAGPLLDTCGTGGDRSGTFNVSTAAAFVAAGAGARVAKHGNRAMSSDCGSADVLEALGAKIDLSPSAVAACIERTGFGFMFAQAFHPALKHAAGPRKEIGVRTVFNVLGPLTNPAGAQAQVLGVAEAPLCEKLAGALERLGAKHALVVHAEDGLDEISLSATTVVHELKDGRTITSTVHPSDLGLKRQPAEALRGGSPLQNADALRRVLFGEPGPLRDFTLVNAAAALVAGDLAPDLRAGLALAAKSIDSGAAREKLESFVRVSNEVG